MKQLPVKNCGPLSFGEGVGGEVRICPACGSGFDCRVNNIATCQCYGIVFNKEAISCINEKYDDCLCRACLVVFE